VECGGGEARAELGQQTGQRARGGVNHPGVSGDL
jgi:hypothetical protein